MQHGLYLRRSARIACGALTVAERAADRRQNLLDTGTREDAAMAMGGNGGRDGRFEGRRCRAALCIELLSQTYVCIVLREARQNRIFSR